MHKFIELAEFLMTLYVIIIVHEFGHYIMGKKYGYTMPEFAIGLGPRIMQVFSYAGTRFVLRWIPIGGAVTIEERDPADEHPSMLRRLLWRDIAVYAAGSLANLVSVVVVAVLYHVWWHNAVQGSAWQYAVEDRLDMFYVMSVILAVINWLPIPPLDGGRMLLAFIEIVRNRRITISIKETVLLWGSLGVFIYIIYDWLYFLYLFFFVW